MFSLSVVVPIYNVEAYLPACLDSLLRQNVEDLEIILVNDGSTDDSQKIIDDYVRRYPAVFRGFQQKNGCPGAARNFGLTQCTKEYLAFLDSDDMIVDNGYRRILEGMERDGAEIGVFECVWFYPDGREEHRPSLPAFLREFNNKTFILSHTSPCNKIFKTSLWQEGNRRFPENIWYEDLAVIPAFAALTDRIGYYPDEIYRYRQRDRSITSKNAYADRFMDIIPACDNVYRLLNGRGYEPELEYLMLFQLCYYASFRFLKFGRFDEMGACIRHLEQLYPQLEKNVYYRTRPGLFRLYCTLLKKGFYRSARLLNALKSAADG